MIDFLPPTLNFVVSVQVGDFGLSKIKRNTLVSGGVRGTLPWMAPELLNGGSNKVSEKVRTKTCIYLGSLNFHTIYVCLLLMALI